MNVGLNVICWNARGIRNKALEFFAFLSFHNIDVGLVTETGLDQNIQKLSNREYKSYRLDRNEKRGGDVAVVVKRTIKHQILPIVKTKLIENIGIEIPFTNGRSIKMFCVYFPGGRVSAQKRFDLNCDLRKLVSFNDIFLVGGDLNCRHRNWGCLRANSWGNILADLHSRHPFHILYPPHPTFIPSNPRANPSTLDLFLTNMQELFSQPVVINDLSSDHFPVKCSIVLSPKQTNNLIFDFQNANWERFRTKI